MKYCIVFFLSLILIFNDICEARWNAVTNPKEALKETIHKKKEEAYERKKIYERRKEKIEKKKKVSYPIHSS